MLWETDLWPSRGMPEGWKVEGKHGATGKRHTSVSPPRTGPSGTQAGRRLTRGSAKGTKSSQSATGSACRFCSAPPPCRARWPWIGPRYDGRAISV